MVLLELLIILQVTNNSNKIAVAIAGFKRRIFQNSYWGHPCLYPALLCPFLKTRPIGHSFLEKRKPSACKAHSLLPLVAAWHLHHLRFQSAKAQRLKVENGQTCVPLAQAKKSSQGKARLIPLKREAPQKEKLNPIRLVQDLPEARRAAKTPLGLSKRQCRPMQEPCRSEAQADHSATLSPTGDAPGDYLRWNTPALLDWLLTVNRLFIKS